MAKTAMFRFVALLLLCMSASAHAQWTHRYPKVAGFNHHIYFEGFELPVFNAGPMYPAASPDGRSLAFSARGWLWLLDLETQQAQRVTQSAGMDARPAWSPDGRELVFVRDTGSQLHIVRKDLASGAETVLVESDTINLDPAFSTDGQWVVYASSAGEVVDLWRVSRAGGPAQSLLSRPGVQRLPMQRPGTDEWLFLNKAGTYETIERWDALSGVSTAVRSERLASQAAMSVSPDGKYLAYTAPQDDTYGLRLLTIDTPDTSVLLTFSEGMPLAPVFSHDGQWLYFSEADAAQRMVLKRIAVTGGAPEDVNVAGWDWGSEPVTRVRLRIELDGEPAAARLSVWDGQGHPVLPEQGAVRSEGQNARLFFYADGDIELTGAAGDWRIAAVQGFATPEVESTVRATAEDGVAHTVTLRRVWDAGAHGWYAGDNHFHLNYGGVYRLAPDDIALDLRGEGLDIAYPLVANLHNRFLEQALWGWRREQHPQIYFGQEVRSHFLGHTALLGSQNLFWPWIWGPGYQVYADDDRSNAEALRHGRASGGLGVYVHPVAGTQNPFTPETAARIPLGLIADAVLGELDLLEIACLWSDEIGTAALWHHVLNIGVPLAATAGSDVMNDYYRTMAIGATRVYTQPEGPLTEASYLAALKAGRSFVSTGPMLEFSVADGQPGDAISPQSATVAWQLSVHSALPTDRVEIFVNGRVVQTLAGMGASGSMALSGELSVPAGGWVTARVSGDASAWPAMSHALYAETSPVWFGAIGSTDATAAAESAAMLLMALDVADARMRDGYGETPIPNLLGHFAQARKRLRDIVAGR